MIYHVFNGRTLHLTPDLVKNIVTTSKLMSISTKHFFIIVMNEKKMLYDNIEENPYDELFTKLNHKDYLLIYSNRQYCNIIFSATNTDKIIYHSVTLSKLFLITNFILRIVRPKLISNSSFVAWGGDYLIYNTGVKNKIIGFLKKTIYTKFKNFITLSIEDQKEVKSIYPKANVVFISYLSARTELKSKYHKDEDKLNIMVSHSGWPHNHHVETFEILKKFIGQVRIICPLCYGDKEYIDNVIHVGQKYFGEDFNYFLDLMSYDDYSELHRTIDIYVTSAEVQTGLGAISCAIDSGTKIFVKENLYDSLIALSYKVYNTNDLVNMSYDTLATPITMEDALFNVNNKNRLVADNSEAWIKWKAVYEE